LEAHLSLPAHPSTTRILLAEESTFVADKLRDVLMERGFQVQTAYTGQDAYRIAKDWRPDFVVYDMIMSDLNGLGFLKALKSENLLGDDKISNGRPRVFVMSSHNSTFNVKECLKFGAVDYLVKPVKAEDLVARLILHMQVKRQIGESRSSDNTDSGRALHFMHLTELLLREGLKLAPQSESLFNLVGMLSLATDAVRVSVIEADLSRLGQESSTPQGFPGFVRASHDKRDIDGLVIDLEKYPEVVFALRSEKTLALDNLKADPTMAAISSLNKSISFNAIIVCPIRIGSDVWGVLSVRLPETKKSLSDFEIRFVQLTANVIGSVIARQPSFLRAA